MKNGVELLNTQKVSRLSGYDQRSRCEPAYQRGHPVLC
jgi:hypothetical protein